MAEGYVYLMQAGNYFKIGRTINLGDRLTKLRTQPPFDVKLIHSIVCDDYTEAESSLHKAYDAKRVRGEWFLLSDVDVEHICSLDSYLGGDFHHDDASTPYFLGFCSALEMGSCKPIFKRGTRAYIDWMSGYSDYLWAAFCHKAISPITVRRVIGKRKSLDVVIHWTTHGIVQHKLAFLKSVLVNNLQFSWDGYIEGPHFCQLTLELTGMEPSELIKECKRRKTLLNGAPWGTS